MTKEERKEKIRLRNLRHRQERNNLYRKRSQLADEYNCPLYAISRTSTPYVSGSWPDPNSPTGYSQKCSYEAWGTCQSPCNGDC